MKALVLDSNNVVQNIVVVDQLSDIPGAISDTGASIGDTVDPVTGQLVQRFSPTPEYQKIMDAQTFMNLLTEDELWNFDQSTDPILQRVAFLFKTRNGEVNVESARFKQVMDAALSVGVFTQARYDELSRGKPL